MSLVSWVMTQALLATRTLPQPQMYETFNFLSTLVYKVVGRLFCGPRALLIFRAHQALAKRSTVSTMVSRRSAKAFGSAMSR
jgi:hypothetical protein